MSRCTGIGPAPARRGRARRSSAPSRSRAGGVEDLLAHDVPWTSLAPKWSAICGQRQAHHDPVGLHVRDVVEQQPRDRDQLQVVGAGRVLPAALLEDGVLRVERERDEREEAARLVLQLAQPKQVVDPLRVGLDVPVQHRAVRRDPEPVRRPVDVEPVVRMLLAGRDEPAHAIREDLGAAAGQRARARRRAARAALPRA